MKLKFLFLIFILAVAISVSADQKQELVVEYMKEAKLDNTLSHYVGSYTIEAKRLYLHIPESFWEGQEYENLMGKYEKSLWGGWRDAYYNYLTEDELIELLKFLKTDLGKKFLNMRTEMEPIFAQVALKSGALLNDEFGNLLNKHGYR